MARGLPWTDPEREQLRYLVEVQEMTVAEAAAVIGRAASSAYNEAAKLGIQSKRRKRRGTKSAPDVRAREGWQVPPEVTRFWEGWDAKRAAPAATKEVSHA